MKINCLTKIGPFDEDSEKVMANVNALTMCEYCPIFVCCYGMVKRFRLIRTIYHCLNMRLHGLRNHRVCR